MRKRDTTEKNRKQKISGQFLFCRIESINNNMNLSICQKHVRARINLYRQERRRKILLVKKGWLTSETLGYSGNILKSKIRFYEAMRKAQLCQPYSKTGTLISIGYTDIPRVLCERRTASHFVFDCTACAYRCCETCSELGGWCWDMAGIFERQEPYVMDTSRGDWLLWC